jgi:hypothetical protein
MVKPPIDRGTLSFREEGRPDQKKKWLFSTVINCEIQRKFIDFNKFFVLMTRDHKRN